MPGHLPMLSLPVSQPGISGPTCQTNDAFPSPKQPAGRAMQPALEYVVQLMQQPVKRRSNSSDDQFSSPDESCRFDLLHYCKCINRTTCMNLLHCCLYTTKLAPDVPERLTRASASCTARVSWLSASRCRADTCCCIDALAAIAVSTLALFTAADILW